MSLQSSEVFIWHENYKCMEQPTVLCRAPSVNSFKIDWINTGHHKNLDTIGKQKYQEPGVEAELNFEFVELTHILNNDIGTTSLTPITSAMLYTHVIPHCVNIAGSFRICT